MRIVRLPERSRPDPIVALIDVVFFLLVFFMLVGRMDATAPFDVAPPVAATGVDMPGGGRTISVARDGTVALDGVETAREDLLGSLPDIAAAASLLRINAHRDTELRHVLPLVSAAEAAGIRDVALVVTPDPE